MLNGNGIDRRGSERTDHDPHAQALESTRATVKNGNQLRTFGCIALKRVINPETDGVRFHCFRTGGNEVEVDLETGMVKVLRVVAAHDVGKAINPMGCEQQIEGAVIMGLSNTLYEEFKMDNGRILNDTLADYKLATMQELPEIVTILVESVQKEGPFGAKGIGEPAAAPTAPAIANAIYNAIGVRIKELPITPDKILSALREKTSA